MSICLKAVTPYTEASFNIGYGEFVRLRMGFLECVDAVFKTTFSPLYDLRFRSRFRYESDPDLNKEYWEVWDKYLSGFGKKTRFLREYGFEADDIYAVSCFVWHNDSDGEFSPEECRKLKKWFSLFLDIDNKREEEGEDNLLWYVYNEELFDNFMFFNSLMSFAAVNNVPLKFS